VADDDHLVAASGDRVADALGGGTRREPLVRLDIAVEFPGELVGRLACPQKRARQDGCGLRAVGRQAPTEVAGCGPAGRGQAAEIVRLTRSSLGVSNEIEAHRSRM
jgi:hypothetical protein